MKESAKGRFFENIYIYLIGAIIRILQEVDGVVSRMRNFGTIFFDIHEIVDNSLEFVSYAYSKRMRSNILCG